MSFAIGPRIESWGTFIESKGRFFGCIAVFSPYVRPIDIYGFFFFFFSDLYYRVSCMYVLLQKT